jgi:hypothetical protein
MGVIIDLDVKGERDGRIFLRELDAQQPEDQKIFDKTFMVRTPSGGHHLYLRIDTEVGNGNAFDNEVTAIDVRGWGGYVVGPGCVIGQNQLGENYDSHGEYEVIDFDSREILPCPEWIEDNYLRKRGKRSELADVPIMEWDRSVNVAKAKEYLSIHPPAIQGRNGNSHTYELATQIRDFGVSPVKCIELINSTGWNNRCYPPWCFDELDTVVDNAYRYAQNRPGEKADFLGMAVEDGLYGTVTDIANDNYPANHPQHDEIKEQTECVSGKLYSLEEWVTRGKRREYIIPGWLPAHGYTAINAERGTGKSTIMLDLAMRIAFDMDWHGLQVKENYVSVYLCGEDDEGLELNTVGWLEHHGKENIDRIIFADCVPNLTSEDEIKIWIGAIKERVANRKAIIFLDTCVNAGAIIHHRPE